MSPAGIANRVSAGGYAALVVGATVAPALAFDAATVRGGAPRSSADLAVASAVVGVPYAVVLLRRLTARDGPARRADVWISAVHGLVVLSVAATALPAAALHLTARLHARVVDGEWPVLLGWSAVLALAVLMAETTRRASLRWLSRGR